MTYGAIALGVPPMSTTGVSPVETGPKPTLTIGSGDKQNHNRWHTPLSAVFSDLSLTKDQ